MRTSAGERDHYKSDKLPSKMMNNRVLIRIDVIEGDGREIGKGVNDKKIIIDGAEWNEAENIVRNGEVVMIPDKLVYRNKFNDDSEGMQEWGTELEVEVGDEVFFGKIASANAESLEVDGVLYYMMPYSRLILAVRDGVLIPLNGYCLLGEVKDKTRLDGFILDFTDKTDKKRGIVTHNGRNNDYYYGTDAVDACVEVGDQVIFNGDFFGFLESDRFAVLEKGIGYCQKCWTVGTMN